MKVYSKNSFDRFGDDLNELILQYLILEDKIRLECVSKQWQRCVYQRQTVIEINESKPTKECLTRLIKRNEYSQPLLDRESLESVLKKCPNITRFSCDFITDSSVLSLIGQYCNRIKTLTYKLNSNDDNVLSFFRMYGHKLEELRLYGHIKEIPLYLEFCPNLIKSFVWDISAISSGYKEILPKLERIESTIWIKPNVYRNPLLNYVNEFKILSDKYSQTIKSLHVYLHYLTEKELKTCIEYISRFENLKELRVTMGSMKISQPIDDCLSLIGQKCTKLLKLDFNIGPSIPISDNLFALFSEFKSIKKLKLLLPHSTVLSGSIESFKHCKQLIDLDIQYSEFIEDFFANIATFVPKLQSLRITNQKHFSDSFIDYFQSMKSIKSVYQMTYISDEQNFYENIWYFGKSLTDVMLSPFGMYLNPITDNCGLIVYV